MIAAIGCGDDDDGAEAELGLVEQLEAVGIGKYFSRPVPVPTSDGDWLRYEFAPSDDGPVCLFGTPYQVFVRPGRNDKVLFYLEGGGGCWNEETCFGDTGLGAKETAEPIADLNLFGGILGRGPGNPMDGWNVVYVPYCDGSVFGGDNVVEYDLGTVYHRGQANISAGLDVMRENFANPSEIVVSGSSAGGYGTFTGYGVMRVAYPDKQIYVLNDSGPGLQNNDDQKSIAERSENWQFEQFVVEGCTRCSEQIAFLVDWALTNDPMTRVGLFSYQRDFVISDFLMVERPAYRDLMFDVTGQVHSAHPDRFKRFLVDGESHTILLGAGVGPGFAVGAEGTFASLAIDGIGLSDWVADFLTDGPAWVDLLEQSGELLTFPDLGDRNEAGTIDMTIVPEWSGSDPFDNSLIQIREPHQWGSRMQLIKDGEFLRFIVTDDTGYEAEIRVGINEWEAGQAHRLTATWEVGATTLYIDGRLVGQNTYPGGLNFEPGTPIYLGSDHSGMYGGGDSQFREFEVYEP